jgi:DNA-directed RNA polymerase specialized sigma24 family protein
MSYAEIAAAMGSTVPAVESLLSRAMAALKAELSRSEVSR